MVLSGLSGSEMNVDQGIIARNKTISRSPYYVLHLFIYLFCWPWFDPIIQECIKKDKSAPVLTLPSLANKTTLGKCIALISRRNFSNEAPLSIFWSVNFGHEIWVGTKRARSKVPAAKMSFLHRVAGLFLRDWVRRSAKVELPLLRFERSQLGIDLIS